MRKIKHFAILAVAALFFTACTNMGDVGSGNASEKEKSLYTLNGRLVLPGLKEASSVRTATASFSESITWIITAKKGTENYTANGSVSDNSFTFYFTEEGNYTITATAKSDDGLVFASGSNEVTVSQGENTVEIKAEPVASVLRGSVNLELNFDSDAASKISSVQVEWLGLENEDRTRLALGDESSIQTEAAGKTYEPSEEVQAAIADLESWKKKRSKGEFNGTFSVTSGKATITCSGIFCGSQKVKLSFNDEVGNTLYSCNEIINVYSGFTTDTWYGTAPYLANGKFTLTGSLLDLYGAEAVPDTQTVLYDYDSETRWSYSFANSDSLLDNAYNQADFCFDSNGNVYLGTNNDVMQFYYYDVSKKQVYSIQTEQISSSGFLDYDFAKNQLCFVTDGKLYKFSQLNENSSDSYSANVTVYNFRTTDLDVGSLLSACIYNDKAYLVYRTYENVDVPFVLLEYDISSAKVDEEDQTQFSIGTPKATKDLRKDMGLSSEDMGLSYCAEITDMLYQDGAVYMLVREYDFVSEGSKRSRGAVLRYNTLTGSLDSIGFADAASLASAKLSAYIMKEGISKPLYNDQALTTQWLVNANKEFVVVDEDENEVSKILYNELPGIFTPAITTSISTAQFYGPSKFVAVKPKKLVIADDGIAFYTDNDVLKYKNVNRIVTVDLNSFSIVGTKEDISANFGDESSKEIIIADTGTTKYQDVLGAALSDEVSFEHPKYYENNDGAKLTSVFNNATGLTIPCGD